MQPFNIYLLFTSLSKFAPRCPSSDNAVCSLWIRMYLRWLQTAVDASCTQHHAPRGESHVPVVGPGIDVDVLLKRKNLLPLPGLEPEIVQSVARSPYWLTDRPIATSWWRRSEHGVLILSEVAYGAPALRSAISMSAQSACTGGTLCTCVCNDRCACAKPLYVWPWLLRSSKHGRYVQPLTLWRLTTTIEVVPHR